MSFRLVVDPIACDGRGLCAELFPERITLDDWGYPIIDPTPFDGALTTHARRAVNTCPVLALHLEKVSGGGSGVRGLIERVPRPAAPAPAPAPEPVAGERRRRP